MWTWEVAVQPDAFPKPKSNKLYYCGEYVSQGFVVMFSSHSSWCLDLPKGSTLRMLLPLLRDNPILEVDFVLWIADDKKEINVINLHDRTRFWVDYKRFNLLAL